MKRRLQVDGGTLVDARGRKVGRIVSLTVELDDLGEGVGGEVPLFTDTSKGEDPSPRKVVDTPTGDGLEEPSRTSTADIDRVWAHYVAVMAPRQTTSGEEERRIIRAALRVASVDECNSAISACAASVWHMGENDRRRKYNKLSQILKGRAGKETTRERIDFFLDIAKTAGVGTSIPTAPSARIRVAKQAVLDGWQFPGDALVVSQGEEAATWLASQGFRIKRDPETGRPSFEMPG